MHASAFQILDDGPSKAVMDEVPSQFVTFTCGSRAFGIDIMAVREIRSWSPVTELALV